MENDDQLKDLLSAITKVISVQNESLSALILTIQSDPQLRAVYEQKLVEIRSNNVTPDLQ